jgi:hypothetical protein
VDEAEFWQVVEEARESVGARPGAVPVEPLAEALSDRLSRLDDDRLIGFDAQLRTRVAAANDWELWAAGYLAAGGMSDDSFDYFRVWAVHLGRETYDRLVAHPDSLADLTWDDEGEVFGEAELLGYLAVEEMDERGLEPDDEAPSLSGGTPTGTPFPEDDDAWAVEHLPRLHARVSAS